MGTYMVLLRRMLSVLLFILPGCPAQTTPQTEDEFKVYTEAPRLLLRPQRLRLLKRERDRQSMRWEQFNTLMSGHAQMPEPGFASALFYAVTGDADAAKQAIEWAATASDTRQVALVFDWCQPAMTPAQSKAIAARLARAAAALAGRTDIPALRDRIFAAMVLADQDPAAAERTLRDLIENTWRKRTIPALRSGAILPGDSDIFALYELLHAVRDNLTIDLRGDTAAWFRELPPLHLLSHYPAAYPAPENDYRIPAYDAEKAPDLRRAALSRATELAMVAYDSNSNDSQFLQGWLMQDKFLLRSAFGIVYEYLWANPYQPGLSYYHFPLAHHDPLSGSLFVRSSWDDDAIWLGKVGKEWQLFSDGKITALNLQKPHDPMEIGESVVFIARDPMRFDVRSAARVYIIGLHPRSKYDVEVDDEEIREEITDEAGTLELDFPPETTTGVRIRMPALGTR
jgi:hypothetical protein